MSTHRGSPNLPDHHGVKDAKVQDTSLQVTKEWMALWPVDHAAHVDTSKSPRTAPTCRLADVTMAIHGSSNPASQDGTLSPSTKNLGPTDPRRLLHPRYRGPHPPTLVLGSRPWLETKPTQHPIKQKRQGAWVPGCLYMRGPWVLSPGCYSGKAGGRGGHRACIRQGGHAQSAAGG